MSENRPEKRKIEFIESYWTGGELGSDYQWNDNHGELTRCRDCKHYEPVGTSLLMFPFCNKHKMETPSDDWFCADGVRKDETA